MKPLLVSLLAAAATVATVPQVHAQPAMALGHPLPDAKLDTGTISVRVIAGSPANNVIGTDVTLVVNGTPRQARTDDTGHAKFPGLTAGAIVQAKILDADKKEVASDQFAVPEQGGAAVMLTTKPFVGGGMPGGGAGPAGPMMGGGGMPEPRQLSGEPRIEPNDPAGTITARLTYNDFKAPPPVGVPVAMVAYAWDDKISVTVVATDKDGRATFGNLDRTGGTSYFLMAELPRGSGVDRLYSTPIELAPAAGVRLVLSAEKRDSTAKPVDDLTKLEKQESVPAGKVLVSLAGVPAVGEPVKLVDATTGKPVAEAKSGVAAPDPSHVDAQSQFQALPKAQLGTLAIIVHGGAGGADAPLDDIEVKVVAEGADAPVIAKTASGGNAMFLLKPDAKGVATITVNGKTFDAKFELPAAGGGGIEFASHWEAQGQPQATFDAPVVAGQVLYAETSMHHQTNRSLPFQLVPGAGTHITIYVLPRVMATYRLGAEIEDQQLGVQGRFVVSNNAWAPYRGGPDGIIVPAPKGFHGGVIAEMDQNDVAVAPDEGFRIIRPLAPGQKQFHAGFSLPVDAGEVHWKMELPFGAFETGIQVRSLPNMIVSPPAGFAVDTRRANDGSDAFVIDHGVNDTNGNGITMMPGQPMELTISGLPAPPSWSRWAPRVLGIIVVATMLGGLGYALRRRGPVADPKRDSRRSKLMDELVEIERTGKDKGRREAILSELERLWVDD